MQCKCNANASPRSPTHGGIKRLKQTNIGVNVKAESHTKQGDSLSVNKSSAAKRKHDANAIKEQTTGKRSFHWWYYVIIVGAIALLYLARMPILNFIHKILTGLRRISWKIMYLCTRKTTLLRCRELRPVQCFISPRLRSGLFYECLLTNTKKRPKSLRNRTFSCTNRVRFP